MALSCGNFLFDAVLQFDLLSAAEHGLIVLRLFMNHPSSDNMGVSGDNDTAHPFLIPGHYGGCSPPEPLKIRHHAKYGVLECPGTNRLRHPRT